MGIWGGLVGYGIMSTHLWLDCKTQRFVQQRHLGDDSLEDGQYGVAFYTVSDFYDLFLFWRGGKGEMGGMVLDLYSLIFGFQRRGNRRCDKSE